MQVRLPPAVLSVAALTYAHSPLHPPALDQVSLHLPAGSRTLLIGANGGPYSPFPFAVTHLPIAGKSTLLHILAGKRLVSTPGSQVVVKGRDVFRDTPDGITYLGTEWSVTPNMSTPAI